MTAGRRTPAPTVSSEVETHTDQQATRLEEAGGKRAVELHKTRSAKPATDRERDKFTLAGK